MPIFEWRCPACSHRQEQLVSNWFAATKAEFRCEKCGEVMDRIPTGASAHFKGSGFYATDYKSQP